MSTAAYDLLLVAHVVAGLVGFGAVAIAGYMASSGRGAVDPASDEPLRRFFSPGRDWPARAIFLVPVLGLWLLLGGGEDQTTQAWPWIGLAIWVAAAGVVSALCWPAERRAQEALAAGAIEDFRAACRRMELGAGATSLLFVAAVVVMVAQP